MEEEVVDLTIVQVKKKIRPMKLSQIGAAETLL